jgi:mono/diheme cytochrome c family protein
LIKGGVMQKHPVVVLSLGIILATILGVTWAGEAERGQEQYLRFCASCHGIDAKGNGAVSKHLTVKPTDLTLLKTNNKGVYPVDHVMSSIDGTRAVRAHGESKMPVWGEVFEKFDKKAKDPKVAAQRKVKVIVEYVSTLQR